jgi:hypothetical protein
MRKLGVSVWNRSKKKESQERRRKGTRLSPRRKELLSFHFEL